VLSVTTHVLDPAPAGGGSQLPHTGADVTRLLALSLLLMLAGVGVLRIGRRRET